MPFYGQIPNKSISKQFLDKAEIWGRMHDEVVGASPD